MQYAKIGDKLISLKLGGSGRPYKDLFNQTNASGHEVFALYSLDNFNNPLQEADEALYKKMDWWAEIFRDIVRNGGRGINDKGQLHVQYTANARTPQEKNQKLWAPKKGFWYPTDDGFFHEGTLVPFATTENRDEAIKYFTDFGIKKLGLSRKEAKNLAKKQVSRFYRPYTYDGDVFVGRGFDPDGGKGRFDVLTDFHPSALGHDRVASRPAIEKPVVVMELKAKK
jgi:hypothetical protein